jgi:hypothetical protein
MSTLSGYQGLSRVDLKERIVIQQLEISVSYVVRDWTGIRLTTQGRIANLLFFPRLIQRIRLGSSNGCNRLNSNNNRGVAA